MSQQLKIEYPGAFYHVMSLGTGDLCLYKTPDDFQTYVIIKSVYLYSEVK